MLKLRNLCHHRRLCVVWLASALCASAATAALPPRHYYDVGEVCDSAIVAGTMAADVKYAVMEARGALTSDRERHGSSEQWWGIVWGDSDLYEVTLRGRNTDFGNITDEYCIDVTAMKTDAGGVRTRLASSTVSSGIAGVGGINTLSVELRGDTLARVYVGKNSLTQVLTFAVGRCAADSLTWGVVAHGRWTPVMVMDECVPDPVNRLTTAWTLQSVIEYLDKRRGADPYEGVWKYFDRTNNPDKVVTGGKYTLATLRNDAGGYDIIYLDGAKAYAADWQPGMIKGQLMPTIFKGHFDLVWYDVLMNRLDDEFNATINQDGALLELAFPLYESVVRFSRVPMSMLLQQ